MKVELSLEEREPLLRQLRVAVAADGHALGFKTRLSQRDQPKKSPRRSALAFRFQFPCTVRAALL
jgi:hypothetical protein